MSVLRQSDPRWTGHKLGVGSSTFGRAGCLLFCLDNARARIRGLANDPVELNQLGVDHDCFDGSSAFTERLAGVGGMVCGPRFESPVDVMAKAIVSYLASGRLILAHVDHDSTLPKGDAEADHWVLVHLLAGSSTLVYDDPAFGAQGGLVLSTLTAPSAYRDGRPYAVRAFRMLR